MNNSAREDKKCPKKPLLYRWDDLVLSFSNVATQLRSHYHGAAEFIIGYEREVRCKLTEGPPISDPCILIPPGVTHENAYQDELSVTLYFDSDSSYFHHLSNEMVRVGDVFTSLANIRRCQEGVRWIYENKPEINACRDRLDAFLIQEAEIPDSKIDARIQAVLNELRQNPASNEPVKYFASKVGLSEDRLHHLFSDVMGLPIHRYRVWLRLKCASQLYFSGYDLTYAAHDAGFSDAAHFSRTFKRMYGASPKETLSARKELSYYFS